MSTLHAVIDSTLQGCRLDLALSRVFPHITRSQFQHWIAEGRVLVNGVKRRKRDSVHSDDEIIVYTPDQPKVSAQPEAIPLDIVYEDKSLLVINKPPGMVVHPGAGNPQGTLMNALLYHQSALGQLPRAGIVHRLDKNTSGLMVVAKSELSRQHLIQQLSTRRLSREYIAIVHGLMVSGGTITASIGRNPHQRTRMAVHPRGKEAVSHYRVLKKYRRHTLLQVRLESGRTHQIRVHMAHLGYPIVGDPDYGGRRRIPPGITDSMRASLQCFKRQALHAGKLGLIHPVSEEDLRWAASVPEDMARLMEVLAHDANDPKK